MKAKLLAALGAGAVILTMSHTAMAGVSVGLNLGIPAPVYVAPAPVYEAPPQPVYEAPPQPVYEAPQAVYEAPPPPPPPVAYEPAEVMAPAVVIGWHGDRYWDGNRWWGRHEWHDHRHWD